MKRRIVIEIEVGDADAQACGICPFLCCGCLDDGVCYCENPSFEIDGYCPTLPGGKRLAACVAAEVDHA